MGNAVGVLPPSKQCVDENEESDNKIGKPMNMNEEEAREDTSSNRRIVPQQPPKAHAARPLRGKIVGEKRIINAHPMRKCLAADESNPSVLKEEARVDSSSRQQIDLEQLPEVHTAKQLRGKRVAGVKRIRDAHSMRKSLAEAGTTFETGVRRSKRIRMRPLEYWKGERFVYGRVDNSMELIGVKYLSPGKGNDNLKVKPFISLETPRIQGAS